MKRCVPMLINEGKKQDQAVAQCLSMFKQKWKAKAQEDGVEAPDEASTAFLDALANFDWDNCPECLERESAANHKAGIYEIDIPSKKF